MRPPDHYDTVVVGGRCAGAATAMLLARAGQRVLVLEAARAGSDTLSTHALMRGGVLQLHRWGLLEGVIAAGAPAIGGTEFHYGDEIEAVEVRPGPGVPALYAPRRTVLDPLLAGAAGAAGAEIRFGVQVTDLLRDPTGRVTGVKGIARGDRTPLRATADLVVGADRLRSSVASGVGAPVRHRGTQSAAFVYGYWSGLAGPVDRYRWYYRPHAAAGAIPTNGGQVCVWVSAPRDRFDRARGDLDAGYRDLLAQAAPALADELATARRDGPVRGFPGVPGFLRAATGPGWALVGDAGWFKDPITAHGITDALRDAELLARAVIDSSSKAADRDQALRSYERARDALSVPLLAVTDRIVAYRWDLAELHDLLVELSTAMRPEIDELLALDRVPLAA